MKLIFAVFIGTYVSSTMGITRCYKTEAFLHLYLQYCISTIFYAFLLVVTLLII